MIKKGLWTTIPILMLILLSACKATPSTPTLPNSSLPTTQPAVSPVNTPVPAKVLQADLAKELGVPKERVKIVKTVPKEELPSALFESGCREVKLDAASMLPQGQAVLLTVGPESYVYYRDGSQWMRCGPSRAHLPAVGVPIGGDRQQMVYLAKEDLAKQLGISVESISVESVEQVDWPDASLGCPEPGKVYAQVITPGFRILLQANGKTYEYHSGANRVVHCGPEGR